MDKHKITAGYNLRSAASLMAETLKIPTMMNQEPDLEQTEKSINILQNRINEFKEVYGL